MPDEQGQKTAEELAADRAITRKRGEVVRWAHTTDWAEIRAEYHRRLQRGETLMLAWRRAMWVVFHRHHNA